MLTAKPQNSLGDDEQYTGRWPELEELLAALPPDQAAAVRLTLLEGLSLRAAASRLGVSRSTVHQAQRKGLTLLRQRLEA